MRSLLALALSVVPLAAFAAVRFEPPNPTSRTPVTAHIAGNYSTCSPTVTRNGRIISITLENCSPQTPPGPTVDVPVDLGIVPPGVYDVVVGYPVILLLLDEGNLVVHDAAPPFQVTPNVEVFGGGGEVTITGKNFGSNPIVKFGEATAVPVSATPDKIVVHAPQHAPGIVDVSVNSVSAVAAFYYVPGDKTPDRAFYEPVLFPVAFAGSGAFGSSWVTDIILRNENDESLALEPLNLFNLGCVFECEVLPPKHSTRTTGSNSSNGILAYLPRQAAPRVHFGVLIRDLSRQSQDLGTEIPVVREKDLFDRPLELLNVPADSRFRVTVRIYTVTGPASVGVRIAPMEGDDLVSTEVLTSGTPAAIQFSLTFPQVAGKGPLRIMITPPVAGVPSLWAFASITNNETQHVTTISPQ